MGLFDAARARDRPLLLRFGEFVLDAQRGVLTRGGLEVPLRRKTWRLLCYMASRPDRVLEKDELHAELWPGVVVTEDSLVQCIVELRRALNDSDKKIIRTMAGRGYRFEVPQRSEDVQVYAFAKVSWPNRSGQEPTLEEAWDLLRRIPDRDAIVAARRRFERELQADGKSGAALTGIALSHIIEVLNRWARVPGWQMELAREAADRALAADPFNALSHHARAHVAMLEGCHFEALAGFRKALELNPGLGRARLRIGIIEIEIGHAERAAAHVNEALRCSSTATEFESQAWFVHGMAAFHLGRDAEALRSMRRSSALNPEGGFPHQWLAVIDGLKGRENSAAEHLAQFCRYAPGHTIESLRATERSWNPVFREQRERFYLGLARAGMAK